MIEHAAIIDSPLGHLGIRVGQGRLVGIDFLPCASGLRGARDALAREVVAQLAAYFDTPGFVFDLPLRIDGTDFQRRVWAALREIPAGTTLSYGQLAERIGSAPRAVGGACRANRIPVVIPCHRVVGRDGPGGYLGAAGAGLKQILLEHERARASRTAA